MHNWASKRLSYFMVDAIHELNISPEDKKRLYNTTLAAFRHRNLEAAIHSISFHMDEIQRVGFVNDCYDMAECIINIEPEVAAALIAAAATLVTAGVGYSMKKQILEQCRSNMAFESGGGVWSTTSSQKTANMLFDLLK